jgi:hypothetical protein
VNVENISCCSYHRIALNRVKWKIISSTNVIHHTLVWFIITSSLQK